MGWRQVCHEAAHLPFWETLAQDPEAVFTWEDDMLVVRWAGNPGLWIHGTPHGLVVRTAEEYLSLSPAGFRVVLDGEGRPCPGLLRSLDDLAQRYRDFRRRVQRYPHPHGHLVDRLALREPCVVGVGLALGQGRVPGDLLLRHGNGVVSVWRVCSAEAVASPSARAALVQEVEALRTVLVTPQTLAHCADLAGRWVALPAGYAQRRLGGEVRRVYPEPMVLVVERGAVRAGALGLAEVFASQGIQHVVVRDVHCFGPRHWAWIG
jgi:hypothetical protein